MLITDYELTRNYNSKNAFDVILDWHDRFQNPGTGFFGVKAGDLYILKVCMVHGIDTFYIII